MRVQPRQRADPAGICVTICRAHSQSRHVCTGESRYKGAQFLTNKKPIPSKLLRLYEVSAEGARTAPCHCTTPWHVPPLLARGTTEARCTLLPPRAQGEAPMSQYKLESKRAAEARKLDLTTDGFKPWSKPKSDLQKPLFGPYPPYMPETSTRPKGVKLNVQHEPRSFVTTPSKKGWGNTPGITFGPPAPKEDPKRPMKGKVRPPPLPRWLGLGKAPLLPAALLAERSLRCYRPVPPPCAATLVHTHIEAHASSAQTLLWMHAFPTCAATKPSTSAGTSLAPGSTPWLISGISSAPSCHRSTHIPVGVTTTPW